MTHSQTEHSERTVIYTPDISALVATTQLPVTAPKHDEDWGLVALGTDSVRIKFVYTDETVIIPTSLYESIAARDDVTEYTVCPKTAQCELLDLGQNAILDIKDGDKPLAGIDTVLPKVVARVFVAQATVETFKRTWPTPPGPAQPTD